MTEKVTKTVNKRGDKRGVHLPDAGKAHRFKPGNKLGGRPKMSDAEKELALKTRTELKVVMIQYLTWTEKEVDSALEESELPILDMMILKALKKGFDSGDMITIDWITDHIMGKRANKVDVNTTNSTTINLKKLAREDLETLKKIQEKSK